MPTLCSSLLLFHSPDGLGGCVFSLTPRKCGARLQRKKNKKLAETFTRQTNRNRAIWCENRCRVRAPHTTRMGRVSIAAVSCVTNCFADKVAPLCLCSLRENRHIYLIIIIRALSESSMGLELGAGDIFKIL